MKISFYCKQCKLDYNTDKFGLATAYGGIKKFISKCPRCCGQQFRLIDNPKADPYYFLSKNVIINRQRFVKDLIQPSDAGFRLYYKGEYDKIQKAEEDYYKKQKAEKKSRDMFYKQSSDKGLAKRVLNKEEEIKYGGITNN